MPELCQVYSHRTNLTAVPAQGAPKNRFAESTQFFYRRCFDTENAAPECRPRLDNTVDCRDAVNGRQFSIKAAGNRRAHLGASPAVCTRFQLKKLPDAVVSIHRFNPA
jgi:hypothetical protein